MMHSYIRSAWAGFFCVWVLLGCRPDEESDTKFLQQYLATKQSTITCLKQGELTVLAGDQDNLDKLKDEYSAWYLVQTVPDFKNATLKVSRPFIEGMDKEEARWDGSRVWCSENKNEDVCGLTLCKNCDSQQGGAVFASKFFPGDDVKNDKEAQDSWTRVAMRQVNAKTNIFVEHWFTIHKNDPELRKRLYVKGICTDLETKTSDRDPLVELLTAAVKPTFPRANATVKESENNISSNSIDSQNSVKKQTKEQDLLARVAQIGRDRFFPKQGESTASQPDPNADSIVQTKPVIRVVRGLNGNKDSLKLTLDAKTAATIRLLVFGPVADGMILEEGTKEYPLKEGVQTLSVLLNDSIYNNGHIRQIVITPLNSEYEESYFNEFEKN